jgi:protein SCO1/2
MIRLKSATYLIPLVGLILFATYGLAFGHDGEKHPKEAAQPSSVRITSALRTEVRIANTQLKDQDRRPVQFDRDVIGDHLVAITTVYTNCTTLCSISSVVMRQVQARMKEHLGKELRLVSISVDPHRDTPARLKKAAKQHQAKAGWIWLTGTRPEIDRTLEGLGLFVINFTEHPATVLVGDARSGEWYRFNGMPDPRRISSQLEALLIKRDAQLAKGE